MAARGREEIEETKSSTGISCANKKSLERQRMTTIDQLPLLKEEEEFSLLTIGGEGNLFYSQKRKLVAKTYWKRLWDDEKELTGAALFSPRTIRYAQREAMIAEMLSEAGLSVPTPHGVFALWIPFHDPQP